MANEDIIKEVLESSDNWKRCMHGRTALSCTDDYWDEDEEEDDDDD